ncbi:NUMOD4 domain-containing protein [Nocardia cyriacigeorgica]|uniref:NUMOD4 domain-containing protein n=1 Tax=Nocardia cyriacigeorgica TaxID=135487 RepID=UPI0013D8B2F8|nr:NUMOD4 domain-containing protein [Nocardia cyriacigeorgica]NEW29473.1 hypothetical protein [Nocardia cyriacigeorgica]
MREEATTDPIYDVLRVSERMKLRGRAAALANANLYRVDGTEVEVSQSDMETFKPIPGFPDYLISASGVVKSVTRVDKRGVMRVGQELKHRENGVVYLRRGGKPFGRSVRKLVRQTFGQV